MDKGKAPPLEEVNGPSPSLYTVPVDKAKAPFLEEGEVNGPLVPLQAGEPGNTTQRASSDVNFFSHDVNIMPLSPQRNFGHRRAHLEAFCHNNDEELINIYFDMEKFSSETPISEKSFEKLLLVSEEKTRVGPQLLMSSSESLSAADRRKAKSAAKLAEIALVDPKRARRMFANGQSALRSKERKMQYMSELKQNVPKLQIESTSLSARLTLSQQENSALTSENNELKLRKRTMEAYFKLQSDLSNLLEEQMRRLKIAILEGGQTENAGSSSFNNHQPVFHPDQAMQSFSGSCLHQLQLYSQHQQQFHLLPEQAHSQHQPWSFELEAKEEGTSDQNDTLKKE